jgi:alpha-glucosidase (family GH31 glycosyl hydrolase)
MNEPSVFDSPEKTISRDALHYKADGTSLQHKDVHNAYARLMIEATY